MSDVVDRAPCPHPSEFREGADCHLCGNSGFVLPGSPWFPPPALALATEDLDEDRGASGPDGSFGPPAIGD
jgi:hypothetical protein